MDDKIKEFIKHAIEDLIENTTNNNKINKLVKKHNDKIHFIPIKHRIFSGLLQSMNIQFGNFVEKLLHKIVDSENKLSITTVSGKKMVLPITKKSDQLIDSYITRCQNNGFDNDLLKSFNKLIDDCLKSEQITSLKEIQEKHDIDVLFSNEKKEFFYLEVKYNDDHDTGKYADINRKFIKSYVGICNILKIYDRDKFKPILYYLTKKKLKGNIYIPEKENIYRGSRLFKAFFTIEYEKLDNLMQNIGDDKDIIKIFDDLYKKITDSNTL